MVLPKDQKALFDIMFRIYLADRGPDHIHDPDLAQCARVGQEGLERWGGRPRSQRAEG